MKAYLCIEDTKEVVKSNVEGEERAAIYFVLKAQSWSKANEETKKLGAKVVRVLTKKETASEAEDGSYDIEL